MPELQRTETDFESRHSWDVTLLNRGVVALLAILVLSRASEAIRSPIPFAATFVYSTVRANGLRSIAASDRIALQGVFA